MSRVSEKSHLAEPGRVFLLLDAIMVEKTLGQPAQARVRASLTLP